MMRRWEAWHDGGLQLRSPGENIVHGEPTVSGDAALRVRHGDLADADVIARLITRAFAVFEGKLVPPSGALDETPDTVRARLADRRSGIAELGPLPVGCVLYERKGTDVYLGRLAVSPGHQRRGIARALIAFVEAEARAMGAASISANVRIQLTANHRLFAASGFREIARHAHPGFASPTFIEFRKPLGSERPQRPSRANRGS